MLNKLLLIFQKKTSGRLFYQKFFHKLLDIYILGLNYNNCDISNNGEKNVLLLIKQTLEKKHQSKIIFDVGANIGNYSQLLTEVLGTKNITIYAFEPSNQTFRKLLSKFASNDHVRLCNFGLSNTEEVLPLFSCTEEIESSLASVYKRDITHIGIEMQEIEKISLDTIDNFCNKNNIDHIDFIKLDVEGHELKVLMGAQKMLAQKRINTIQFEFGGCNIDSRTYFKDYYKLLINNYKIFRILKDGLSPIEKYDESLEIFKYSNYLAIIK